MRVDDVLEEAALLGKEVDGRVRLALVADEARDHEGGVLALDGNAVGIDVRNVQLDAGVILRSDQTVGVRAVLR